MVGEIANGPVDAVARSFNSLVKAAIAPTFQLKTMGTKSIFPKNPWYTEQCKILKNNLRELRNRTTYPYHNTGNTIKMQKKNIRE